MAVILTCKIDTSLYAGPNLRDDSRIYKRYFLAAQTPSLLPHLPISPISYFSRGKFPLNQGILLQHPLAELIKVFTD